MPLYIENSLKKERRFESPKSKQKRTLYLFPCSGCGKEMWVSKSAMPKRTGECRSCLGRKSPNMRERKRPYEWIYNHLVRIAGSKHGVVLTFEEFVEFTKTNACHYCGSLVTWSPHNTSGGGSKGWHLDRKDNDHGYSKENCVVACPMCNRIKNNHLSYEEMLRLSPVLREIVVERRRMK
jgi:hypothetical protein